MIAGLAGDPQASGNRHRRRSSDIGLNPVRANLTNKFMHAFIKQGDETKSPMNERLHQRVSHDVSKLTSKEAQRQQSPQKKKVSA